MKNRIVLFSLPAIVAIGMAGCATFGNKAVPNAAVDEKPMAAELTNPTPSPASNSHTREDVLPVSPASGSTDTIIQIGDDLDVSVAEDSSFNGIYEVRRGGYFILPGVGRIDAAGLTLKKVEDNVSKVLEDTQLLHATVKVVKLDGTDSGRRR